MPCKQRQLAEIAGRQPSLTLHDILQQAGMSVAIASGGMNALAALISVAAELSVRVLQVQGLCLGMMAGTATYASAFAGVWLLTDWQKEAERAADRVGMSEPLLPSDSSAARDEVDLGAPAGVQQHQSG